MTTQQCRGPWTAVMHSYRKHKRTAALFSLRKAEEETVRTRRPDKQAITFALATAILSSSLTLPESSQRNPPAVLRVAHGSLAHTFTFAGNMRAAAAPEPAGMGSALAGIHAAQSQYAAWAMHRMTRSTPPTPPSPQRTRRASSLRPTRPLRPPTLHRMQASGA